MDVMKNLIITLLVAVAGVTAVHAQTYQPAAVRGSVLGAVAGAFIGGHNNDRWAEGAVIGAAAGAILGTIVDGSRQEAYCPPQVVQPGYVQTCAPYAAPQVVYVTAPPRVVYVRTYAAPRVVARPVVYVGGGYGHDNRRHRHGYRNW
jgi:uncharacterized protein YcfJ